jgi:hypothetical protein
MVFRRRSVYKLNYLKLISIFQITVMFWCALQISRRNQMQRSGFLIIKHRLTYIDCSTPPHFVFEAALLAIPQLAV